MGRRPIPFTQAVLTRTMKAAVACGTPFCITIDPRTGMIKIEPIIDKEKTCPDSGQVSDLKRHIVL